MDHEIIQSVSSLIVAATAIIATTTAVRGLTAWKKQRKWERDNELAEDHLVLLAKRRHAISGLRDAVFSYDPKYVDENGEEVYDTELANFLGLESVYNDRWGRLYDIRSEIYAKRLIADVRWGTDLSDLLEELFGHEQILRVEIMRYLRSRNPKNSQEMRRVSAAKMSEPSILYKDDYDGDDYGQKYDDYAKNVERYLKQKLN